MFKLGLRKKSGAETVKAIIVAHIFRRLHPLPAGISKQRRRERDSMHASNAALARIIGAIGTHDFTAAAAASVRGLLGFDLGAVVLHRSADKPILMFDDFHAAGGELGMRNYVGVTYAINPLVASAPRPGAFRARDAVAQLDLDGLDEYMASHVVLDDGEEMGFRTVGWPRGLEEVGLYFAACGGLVELSVYRPRARHRATAAQLRNLQALGAPLAAAFDRHAALVGPAAIGASDSSFSQLRADGNSLAMPHAAGATPRAAAMLSPRESQVTELLLAGCSSEAIALRLHISRHTVKDHRKQIFRKLRVGSLAELFASQRDSAGRYPR
jgi:DNA-binding CsgD family transcriptional regulator